MNEKLEDRIQKEIRRRAFERAQIRLNDDQRTQFTLAALEEVTGLSREELEAIADDVRRQYAGDRDKFLNIRSQWLILLAVLASLVLIVWLLFQLGCSG